MPTALIVTADLGGNLPPLLGVARELRARGWTVVVHGDEALRSRVEPLGLRLEVADGVRYDATRPRSTVATLREIPAFWADRTRGRDAVAAAARVGADVAVVDPLLQGPLAELERAGVRTAVVLHSTWEGTRAFLGGPVGALLRLRGVAPARTLARADRVLVASDEGLGRAQPMPPNARLTGPVLEDPPTPPGPRTGRPTVLVGLSTVAFPGQRAVLQRLLDAVADLPVDVRAATGRSVVAAGLVVGANTTLEERVDHAALLPVASAIVSHGGHATVVRALAHGLPMLLVPLHPLMDQPRIARAVAAAGAGLVVPRSASPARMRAALTRLLTEPAFTAAADRLGARFRAADGARRAADEIAGLAADAGRPATVARGRPARIPPEDVSRAR